MITNQQSFSDVCRYGTKMSNNFHSTSERKYKKICKNNDNGRIVQCLAWKNDTEMLNDVTKIGQVIFYNDIINMQKVMKFLSFFIENFFMYYFIDRIF